MRGRELAGRFGVADFPFFGRAFVLGALDEDPNGRVSLTFVDARWL